MKRLEMLLVLVAASMLLILSFGVPVIAQETEPQYFEVPDYENFPIQTKIGLDYDVDGKTDEIVSNYIKDEKGETIDNTGKIVEVVMKRDLVRTVAKFGEEPQLLYWAHMERWFPKPLEFFTIRENGKWRRITKEEYQKEYKKFIESLGLPEEVLKKLFSEQPKQ